MLKWKAHSEATSTVYNIASVFFWVHFSLYEIREESNIFLLSDVVNNLESLIKSNQRLSYPAATETKQDNILDRLRQVCKELYMAEQSQGL